MTDNNTAETWAFLGGLILTIWLIIEGVKWLLWAIPALLAWIWHGLVALLYWVLAWPLFSGVLLLALITAGIAGGLLLVGLDLYLSIRWRPRFIHAVVRGSEELTDQLFVIGDEVRQLTDIAEADPTTRHISLVFTRMERLRQSQPTRISFTQVNRNNLNLTPTQPLWSKRLHILRHPGVALRNALQTAGLELLDSEAIEAKAWTAACAAVAEEQQLQQVRETIDLRLNDAEKVLGLSADNELVTHTRRRAQAMKQRLGRDLERIDQRLEQLRISGLKLHEFLLIPRSLRAELEHDDIDHLLAADGQLSSQLFEELAILEDTYQELLPPPT
jgi:hypothetical protein